jgi:hypothetical protein
MIGILTIIYIKGVGSSLGTAWSQHAVFHRASPLVAVLTNVERWRI